MKKQLLLGMLLSSALCLYLLAQQGTGPTSPPSGQVGITSGAAIQLSPTQFGVNALTLPASSTSAVSAIVDMRGVREATMQASCTQALSTTNIQVYDLDGATNLLPATATAVTTLAATTLEEVHWGVESTTTQFGGAAIGTFTLGPPFRAMSVSFTNAGATPGTCTARLLLQY